MVRPSVSFFSFLFFFGAAAVLCVSFPIHKAPPRERTAAFAFAFCLCLSLCGLEPLSLSMCIRPCVSASDIHYQAFLATTYPLCSIPSSFLSLLSPHFSTSSSPWLPASSASFPGRTLSCPSSTLNPLVDIKPARRRWTVVGDIP